LQPKVPLPRREAIDLHRSPSAGWPRRVSYGRPDSYRLREKRRRGFQSSGPTHRPRPRRVGIRTASRLHYLSNRCDDVAVRSTATEIPAHAFSDLGVVQIRISIEVLRDMTGVPGVHFV